MNKQPCTKTEEGIYKRRSWVLQLNNEGYTNESPDLYKTGEGYIQTAVMGHTIEEIHLAIE